LVAIFNEEEEKYHVYLTNILNEDLGPEDVAKLYGVRWDVEIVQLQMPLLYT
jgi:putative transposase